MPPQNTPPPPSGAAYDFFMKPPKQPRKLMGPSSKGGRIALVAGGAAILLILFIIVSSMLSGGSSTPSLLKVLQDQNEIVRISTAAQQKTVSTNAQQFAATTQLSTASAQADLIALLKTNNITYSQKQLGLTQSSTTDQQLSAAAAASLYDQTYESVMKTELQQYAADLQTSFKENKSTKLRALLNTDYTSAQLLIKSLGTTPATSP